MTDPEAQSLLSRMDQLEAEQEFLKGIFQVLRDSMAEFYERLGAPLVSGAEARAILAPPAEPLAPVVALADRRAL